MSKDDNPSEELSAAERNRFLRALIRQGLVYRTLTPDEHAMLIAGLLDGTLHLGPYFDHDRELSRDELREFAGMIGGRSYEGYDAEDFLYEVLSKLLASPPDHLLPEVGADASAWFNTVVWNHRRDARKAENRHDRILRRAALDPGSWLSAVRLSESPETIVLRHQQHLENLRRIGRLPKKLGDVAYLRYEGYTIQETATALGITSKAVYRRLDRIRSPRIRGILGLPDEVRLRSQAA